MVVVLVTQKLLAKSTEESIVVGGEALEPKYIQGFLGSGVRALV